MKWVKTLPIFIVFIILLLPLILSGCSNVRGFADLITENILVSINEKNYESFLNNRFFGKFNTIILLQP